MSYKKFPSFPEVISDIYKSLHVKITMIKVEEPKNFLCNWVVNLNDQRIDTINYFECDDQRQAEELKQFIVNNYTDIEPIPDQGIEGQRKFVHIACN